MCQIDFSDNISDGYKKCQSLKLCRETSLNLDIHTLRISATVSRSHLGDWLCPLPQNSHEPMSIQKERLLEDATARSIRACQGP